MLNWRGLLLLLPLLGGCAGVGLPPRYAPPEGYTDDDPLSKPAPPGVDWQDDALAVLPDKTGFLSGPDLQADVATPWEKMPTDLFETPIPDKGDPRPQPTRPPVRWDDGQNLPAVPDTSNTTVASLPPADRSNTPRPTPETPTSIPARVAMGWKAFYDDGLDVALQTFQALSVDAPERPDVWLGLGRCRLARGEVREAREAVDRGVALAPDDAELRFYEGVVAYQEGHLELAVALWTRAAPLVEARPPGALRRDHAWLLARACFATGRKEEGQSWFEKALQEGGEEPDGTLNPPPLLLERLSDGSLPAPDIQPVGGWQGENAGGMLLTASRGAIWRLKPGSPVAEQVSHPPPGWSDSLPAPEPGGTRLALISTSEAGSVQVVVEAADGTRTPLPIPDAQPVRPAWSPDRTQLAVVALIDVPLRPRVHFYRFSTGDLERLSWPVELTTDPAFSGSRELIFAGELENAFRLGHFVPGQTSGAWIAEAPLVEREAGTQAATSAVSSPGVARAPFWNRPPVRLSEPWMPQAADEDKLQNDPDKATRQTQAADLAGAGGGSTDSPAPRPSQGSVGLPSRPSREQATWNAFAQPKGGWKAPSGWTTQVTRPGAETEDTATLPEDSSNQPPDAKGDGGSRIEGDAGWSTVIVKGGDGALSAKEAWLKQVQAGQRPMPGSSTLLTPGGDSDGDSADATAEGPGPDQSSAPGSPVETAELKGGTSLVGAEKTGERAGATREVGDRAARVPTRLPGSRPAPGEAYFDAREPAPSPVAGDDIVAYVRNRVFYRQIWLIEPSTRRALVLTPEGVDCHGPSFSPDGARLLYTCRVGEVQQLFLYERYSRHQLQLTRGDQSFDWPVWELRQPSSLSDRSQSDGNGER